MRSNVKIFFFTLLILFLSFLVPSAQQNSPKSKISSESDSLITARPTGLKTEENPPITVTRPSIREDSIPLPIIKAALDRKEIPLDKERFRSFLDSIRVRKDSESAEPPPVEQGTYQIPTAVFESRIPECKIFLKAREFAPVIGLSQVLASQPKAGRTHLMIQFYDIPSDADIRTMESHGVILLDYIPNYTYYASVPAADSELLSLPMVRSVCEIESNDKISPNIRDYGIGDWARDTNGNVKLNVIFFGDVSKLVALSVAERYGRVISSSDIGNLFVISIPETSIGDLVNESDVQWVEQVAAGNMELLDQVRGATGAETVQAAPGDEALDDPTPCLTYKEIYSTVPGNKYWEMAGTSMAAPVVSGALGLMKQQFNKLGYGEIKPHTFKAILVQSADDVGNPGSGYSYGHGNLNLKTAIDLIINNYPKNDLIRVGTVADDETDNYYMNVPSGVNKLRVTLVWDDIEGTPAAAKELVNDLDLLLTDPNGVNHYAYRLDKDNPGANATKGFNSLDNVEVVEVDNPVAGHWTIRVWGWIVTGTEEYTVVAPYEDVKCGDYLYQNTELTYDLDCDSSQDGLNLNADNITLDCKGHKIRGNYNGSYWSFGVWIMNNKGNTIRNCEITNFDEGIYIDNSDNNTVYSCTVDSNAFDGIYLTTGSDNNNILYSSIQSNGWYLGSAGVYITTNSSSNILFANDLTNNPEVGLKIDHSSIRNVVELNSFSNDKRAVVIDSSGQNSVISNMMENNSFYGILSSRATGDDYSRNLLHNNTYGIRLWSSGSNNRITENKINNHLNYGIYIYNTDSGEVRHNLIDNTSFGIYFNHAYNWKAIADTIENCKNYGIYMESDTDVRIDSNYICSNKEDIRDLNSSSGDNNNCQFVYNWADDGEAEGCTHSCLLCGDVIQDSNINVTDVVYLVNYLFKGGPAPLCPPSPYLDCADANGDETVSVADVIYLINYLFKGGPRPVC